MEPEGSLPHLLMPATGPYPEPQCTLHGQITSMSDGNHMNMATVANIRDDKFTSAACCRVARED
jgi:hypothetical protein